MKKIWTNEKIEILKNMYENTPTKELIKILEFTRDQIISCANKLG